MSVDGGVYYPSPSTFPFKFHLLKVTLVLAQYLFKFNANIRHNFDPSQSQFQHPDRCVRHKDPTWNQKFIFRGDDATLLSDTSVAHICRPHQHLLSLRLFLPGSDTLVGNAREVISMLCTSPTTRFIALQGLMVEAKPTQKVVSTKAAEEWLYKDGSMEGLGEKERALEKKLAGDSHWEKEVQEGSGKRKPRSPHAVSCFNIARKYVYEIYKDKNIASS